jgi:hypothetical protein
MFAPYRLSGCRPDLLSAALSFFIFILPARAIPRGQSRAGKTKTAAFLLPFRGPEKSAAVGCHATTIQLSPSFYADTNLWTIPIRSAKAGHSRPRGHFSPGLPVPAARTADNPDRQMPRGSFARRPRPVCRANADGRARLRRNSNNLYIRFFCELLENCTLSFKLYPYHKKFVKGILKFYFFEFLDENEKQ